MDTAAAQNPILNGIGWVGDGRGLAGGVCGLGQTGIHIRGPQARIAKVKTG